MNTLIIHPEDNSTDFLDVIYRDIQDKLVIRNSHSKQELKELMGEFDRIMMMGHGSPSGLFSVSSFPSDNGFIIDSSFVDILKQKEDSVYIWCHASDFVEEHGLKGFCSGMFISEVSEASFCGLKDIDQKVVDESNFEFCDLLANVVERDSKSIFEIVSDSYGRLAKVNKVAAYNLDRLKLA